MPAVECHGKRPFGEQVFEADQMPFVVGKQEGRHRMARLRSRSAGVNLLQASNQTIDGIRKGRRQSANFVCERLQPFVQRGVQVAATHKGRFEGVGAGLGHGLQVSHSPTSSPE